MPILGTDVGDPNFQLRFFILVFMGILALGAVMFWRSRLIVSSTYMEIPIAKHLARQTSTQNF